ncbi:MAG TPA: 3-deoxy-8-phosphooctulonate synthase [Gemmatimonadales bacterium]|jgi:2-dehydro-3-deoxyphosphooctonate aldolase (KDO 8-P synthase)
MTFRWTPGPVLVAGPCVLEDDDTNFAVARSLAVLAVETGWLVVYKASFDKANRSRPNAPRGPGLVRGLQMLRQIRDDVGLPVLTDVHEVHQVATAAAVVDALQVPALLARQSDLLAAVGASGCAVNLKKGQWMAPEEMAGAVDKVRRAGAAVVAVTERGTAFGYGDLVVDMRSFRRLREATGGAAVLFDATHAAQRPGMGPGGASGGERRDVPQLLAAAAAAGADGFFIETHPDPDRAHSDAATQWPLADLPALVARAATVWQAVRAPHAVSR